LDENIAALWVWLNASKSDDLRTNAFRTSTKCKSHGKKYLLVVTIVATLQSEDKCIFYPYFRVKPYVLSCRSECRLLLQRFDL